MEVTRSSETIHGVKIRKTSTWKLIVMKVSNFLLLGWSYQRGWDGRSV